MEIIYGIRKYVAPLTPFEQLLLKQCAENREMDMKEYIKSCDVILPYEEMQQNPDPAELSIYRYASQEEKKQLRRLLKESYALEARAQKNGVEPGEYIANVIREHWRLLFPVEAVKTAIRTLRLCAAASAQNDEEYSQKMRKYGLKVSGNLVLIPREIQPTLTCNMEGDIFTMGVFEDGESHLLELQAFQ